MNVTILKNVWGFVTILIFFSSCYTQKTAKKDLIKIDAFYPILLTQYCAKTFKTDTIIKSDTIINIDTFYSVQVDSVECPQNIKGEVVKLPCPPNKTIIETKIITDTFIVENKANLSLKDSIITHLSQDNLKAEIKSEKWRKMAIGFIVSTLFLLTFIIIWLWQKLR